MTRSDQRGQALVEALLILALLGVLVISLGWLGRLQDIGLQLTQGSRRVAFATAHQGLDPDDEVPGLRALFAGAGHRWFTRQGTLLLPDGLSEEGAGEGGLASAPGVRLAWQDGTPVAEWSHPPDPFDLAAWRAELNLGSENVWRARLTASLAGIPSGQTEWSSTGLHDLDQMPLTLQRHTAIMTGGGAADSDEQAQSLLAASERAWVGQSRPSQQTGASAARRLAGIDAAWGRAQPRWDWTRAWSTWVPDEFLHAGDQP